jgi:hypothetical protein
MNQNLSRRDFLKIAGVGLGALAFRPRTSLDLEYFSAPRRLPQFPASDIIGRVLEPGIDLRSQPTTDESVTTSLAKLEADHLVEWGRQAEATDYLGRRFDDIHMTLRLNGARLDDR